MPFRDRGRFSLPASWDGRCRGRFAVPCGWRRRVVVLAFIGSLVPLPLGAGDYVRSAVIGSACCEGVGVSSRFPLSRGSSSCNLAARCHRLSLPASPSPCVVLIIAPCLMCFVPAPLRPFLSPVFLCGFLSSFSPFLRLVGLGVLCLLAHALRLLFPSHCSPSVSCPLRLLACLRKSSSLVPLCVSLIASCDRPHAPRLARVLSSSLFVLSPRLSTSVGGERGGSFFACLPSGVVVRAAGGVGWIAAAGRRRRGWFVAWRGCWSAGCVRFVASVFVYINWALARVS